MVDSEWQSYTSESVTMNFNEGQHQILVRAVDRVGNIGDSITVDVNVDTSEPEGIAWSVEELTTSE